MKIKKNQLSAEQKAALDAFCSSARTFVETLHDSPNVAHVRTCVTFSGVYFRLSDIETKFRE